MTCNMRFAVLVLVLLGCGNKSKLDANRGGDADTLWDLAPDDTELGIVASPRAVGAGLRALAAARQALELPDFEVMKPDFEAQMKSMFGETAAPEDAGLAPDRAFAMFVTKDGSIRVMPVADRDKFMAVRKGERGSAEDTIQDNVCRQLRGHYVCVNDVRLFDRIGKGKQRGVTTTLGARGDAELYIRGLSPFGASQGDLLLAAQVEPGQIAVHGRWTGNVDGPLAKLVGVVAPQPDTKGDSGFLTVNLAPLLAYAPPIPIAGGVTLEQLAKSAVGPITLVTPSGDVDLQFTIPLTDPKAAQTIVDNCKDVGALFKVAEKQTPGACRVVLQGTSAVEIDIWVEGNALRVGAKKGPTPAGKPGGLTPFGRELAGRAWTFAAWGRGTLLNLSGMMPKEDVPPGMALMVHLMALINELGFAARVEKDGVQFRLMIRTAWANPPDVTAKVIAIHGNDIITGKATDAGRAIAAGAPSSPFAADFDAGQGGLMMPLALTSFASGLVFGPATMRMFANDEAPPAARR